MLISSAVRQRRIKFGSIIHSKRFCHSLLNKSLDDIAGQEPLTHDYRETLTPGVIHSRYPAD